MSDFDMASVRRAFARQMVGLLGTDNQRLENAFAAVPRERFLGHGPWHIRQWRDGFIPLPSNDPVYIYQDVLVALDPKRGVNNGSPSLHARMLQALEPKVGDVVAHIGAGTGYYSAILAELVGPEGRVIAVEFDAILAEQARANLAAWPNVDVITGDGMSWPTTAVDGIYVNFAVSGPAKAWIETLRQGARLVFPLGAPDQSKRSGPRHANGVVLRIIKGEHQHPAEIVCPASFVFAEGDAATREPSLVEAFKRGGVEFVRSLAWDSPVDASRCWYVGKGWALCY